MPSAKTLLKGLMIFLVLRNWMLRRSMCSIVVKQFYLITGATGKTGEVLERALVESSQIIGYVVLFCSVSRDCSS